MRFTNAVEQHRELNPGKAADFPWMCETSKCASREALRDLGRAFRNFVRSRRAGRYCGFPPWVRSGVDPGTWQFNEYVYATGPSG